MTVQSSSTKTGIPAFFTKEKNGRCIFLTLFLRATYRQESTGFLKYVLLSESIAKSLLLPSFSQCNIFWNKNVPVQAFVVSAIRKIVNTFSVILFLVASFSNLAKLAAASFGGRNQNLSSGQLLHRSVCLMGLTQYIREDMGHKCIELSAFAGSFFNACLCAVSSLCGQCSRLGYLCCLGTLYL